MEREPPWNETRYLRIPLLPAKAATCLGHCRCEGTTLSPWLPLRAGTVPNCCWCMWLKRNTKRGSTRWASSSWPCWSRLQPSQHLHMLPHQVPGPAAWLCIWLIILRGTERNARLCSPWWYKAWVLCGVKPHTPYSEHRTPHWRHHRWAPAEFNPTTSKGTACSGEVGGLFLAANRCNDLLRKSRAPRCCVLWCSDLVSWFSPRVLGCPVPFHGSNERPKDQKKAHFKEAQNCGWQTTPEETALREAIAHRHALARLFTALAKWQPELQSNYHRMTWTVLTPHLQKKLYISMSILPISLYSPKAKLFQHQGILSRSIREEERFGKM